MLKGVWQTVAAAPDQNEERDLIFSGIEVHFILSKQIVQLE